MKQFSATYVFTGNSSPIKNGVIVTSDDGEIIEVLNPTENEIDWNKVEKYDGIICPGFVNTHCHLELSYLKGKIKEKTQLHGFIKSIIAVRENYSEEVRLAAIQEAEKEMYNNGIVAVGDISNGTSSFAVKQSSKIKFHTFIEVFGSDPAIANEAFNHAKEVYQQHYNPELASITPHAT